MVSAEHSTSSCNTGSEIQIEGVSGMHLVFVKAYL